MENQVISGLEYKLPEVALEQKKIILIDVLGRQFEATFNVPNTKEMLEMEEAGKAFISDDKGTLFEKKSDVKKIEWILEHLLVVPVDLKLEHLNKLSAKEIADTFR